MDKSIALGSPLSGQCVYFFLFLIGQEFFCFGKSYSYLIGKLQQECGLNIITKTPTTNYEDNTTCIELVSEGYIKGDRIKNLSIKLFFTHDLQKDRKIKIQRIQSCTNPVDLFTVTPIKDIQTIGAQNGM